MAADVADDAAAGLAAVESPGVLAAASKAGEVAEPEMERLAQVALVDQSLQVLVHGHVAVGEGYEGDRLGGGRRACHLLCLGDIEPEWFLAQHVESPFDRLDRQRVMRVVRRCDDDGVEWLLEELGGVGEGGGDLPLPGERRGAVGVAAEDGGHVDTIKASQCGEVHRIGPPGRADDADADSPRHIRPFGAAPSTAAPTGSVRGRYGWARCGRPRCAPGPSGSPADPSGVAAG